MGGAPDVGRRALPQPLAPLIAGARARGVADGLEWLGLAAVLIDDRGEALHVNAGAVELMGEALYLERGRLRSGDAEVDRRLDAAIDGAVVGGAPTRVAIPAPGGGEALWLRVGAIAAGERDAFQLLRAVAILEPGHAAAADPRH